MTDAARGVLVTLDTWLKANPKTIHRLYALHEKTLGEKLAPKTLWRHRVCERQPRLDTTLVYLAFLSLNRCVIASLKPGVLFTYAQPEWLRAPKGKHER